MADDRTRPDGAHETTLLDQLRRIDQERPAAAALVTRIAEAILVGAITVDELRLAIPDGAPIDDTLVDEAAGYVADVLGDFWRAQPVRVAAGECRCPDGFHDDGCIVGFCASVGVSNGQTG